MNSNAPQKFHRRILVIDDTPLIHEDIRKIVAPGDNSNELDDEATILFGNEPKKQAPGLDLDLEIDSAYQGQEGLAMVEKAVKEGRPYMMAFVDMRMPPGWNGIETIEKLWKSCPALQIVICTAYSDQPWHEINARLGTSANLLILKKPFDNMEVLQLVQTLTYKWIATRIAERKMGNMEVMFEETTYQMVKTAEELAHESELRNLAELELRRSEERFHSAFKDSLTAIAILKSDTLEHTEANSCYLELLGRPKDQVIGRTLQDLNLLTGSTGLDLALGYIREGKPVRDLEITVQQNEVKKKHALISIVPMILGNSEYLLFSLHDITALRQTEAQLRQVQKLESIGQLVGGVAHDFNNILTAISLNLSILSYNLKSENAASGDIKEIESIIERASNLTRQLLIFSSQTVIQTQSVHLKAVIESMLKMLGRLLGAKVSISYINQGEAPILHADKAMMEQILMNLALNARDAMNGNGKITISTCAVEIDERTAKLHPEGRSGQFIRLSVSDTGSGMSEETVKRIFEPFFTTKPTGKGTGLGLATVFGIVKKHKGWIQVETRLGKGTTFHIFLPAQTDTAGPRETKPLPLSALRGHGTILLVEDEEDVRHGISNYLRQLGYEVLEACNGDDAVDCWQSNREKIGLLYTDMVIPGKFSGLDLAHKMKAEKNSLGIIVSSGYSIDINAKNFPVDGRFVYLPKPAKSEVIANTVYGCIAGDETVTN